MACRIEELLSDIPSSPLAARRPDARRLQATFCFSSRSRHTRCSRDWSSDVCSSDLELEPLALPEELPVGELIADHVRPRRGLVHDRDARLELPGPREQRGQVDAGLPIDAGTERLVEQYPAQPARGGRIGNVKLLSRVADVVGHVQGIAPVPGPDAERRLQVQGTVLNDLRFARIVDARVDPRPRRETLLVLPAEADGRPGDVELAETLEGDASVDEPVEPLVAALGSE